MSDEKKSDRDWGDIEVPESTPTTEFANAALHHDSTTGFLYWKPRPVDLFATERAWKIWTTRCSGKRADTSITDGNGLQYRRVRLLGKVWKAHRIIWLMHHGELPAHEIDHINGDSCDNRIENLRAVTKHENLKNQSRYKSNKSGHTGVFWNKKLSKYQAYINDEGKLRHLGCFVNIDDALAARKLAERKLGYHPNHGR